MASVWWRMSFRAGAWRRITPETNPLVPLSSVADQARTPTSKSIPVMLVPSQVARTADTQAATTAEA